MVVLLPHPPPPTRRNRAVDSPHARRGVELSCRRLRTAGPGERPTGRLSARASVFAVFAAFAALILPIAAPAAGPPAPNNGGVLARYPRPASFPTARRASSSVLRPSSSVRAPTSLPASSRNGKRSLGTSLPAPPRNGKRSLETSLPGSPRNGKRSQFAVFRPSSLSGHHAGYPLRLVPRAPRPAPVTLLNELGRLARPVSSSELAAWKAQLHHGHLPADQAAKLHIRLGEYELAANEQPGTAIWQFGRVSKRAPARLRGLAKYDTAVAGYYQGAYADTQQAFKRLLSPKTGLPGYSIKACALWVRMAGVCAGYHAQHSKMGIPEPPRLDPYCGAAALAECLRSMGRPYDKATLVSACRVTGEGSTLQDIVDAGKKLGVIVRPVTANDAGLIALPKPVIAHVEHDHFIVVIRADENGVTYICSDCGPWPGGKVRLTWNQWHMMDADVYGVVTRPGTARDDWMAAVLSGKRPPAQVAGLGPLKGLIPALEERALIRVSVIGNGWPACDSKPEGPVCPCFIDSPKDGGGPGGGVAPAGPSPGDPVDLATGGEDYSPDADLTVYNPIGPSVVWRRTYSSLGTDVTGLGMGWWNPYFLSIDITAPYEGQGDYLLATELPGGSEVDFSAATEPSPTQPTVTCSTEPGAPMTATWSYNPTAPGGPYFVTIASKDRSELVAGCADETFNNEGPFYNLVQELDRNGNAINMQYNASGLLSEITDSAGVSLLTVSYDGNNNISAVSDRYNRSVYYQVGLFGSDGYYPYGELTQASQIVPTGTVNPPLRYTYDYQLISAPGGESVPFLHTITVPSPTGAGNSTATINNTPEGYVGSLVDANGNSRAYSFPDSNHTTVTVTNPQAQVVYSYTTGFNNDMSCTTRTDGAGTIVETKVYGDPNDPYRASQVIDGNGSNVNPEVVPGSDSVFGATGADAPATGTWDIVLNGAAVANSGAPNGWSVNLDTTTGVNNFTVGAPAGATIATGYEVRYSTQQYYYYYYYSAPFDVVAPGTIRKGTTSFTWDQYGNMQTKTSPRGTLTADTWSYTNFALGELTQVQVGAKSPISFTYYEPSGLRHTVAVPLPGTSGSGQTAVTTLNWDALGNLTSVVRPGNNSTSTITTSYGFTTDGAYQQPEALGEPITITDNLGKVWHLRYGPRGNYTS